MGRSVRTEVRAQSCTRPPGVVRYGPCQRPISHRCSDEIPDLSPAELDSLSAGSRTLRAVTAYGFFERVTVVFEILGVIVLVLGLLASFIVAVAVWRRYHDAQRTTTTFRNTFGSSLLLSLEILIAADLTRTLTIEPTLANVLVLGTIVLIRTVLSISLDVEMDGVAPWRRRVLESGGEKLTRTVRNATTDTAP